MKSSSEVLKKNLTLIIQRLLFARSCLGVHVNKNQLLFSSTVMGRELEITAE